MSRFRITHISQVNGMRQRKRLHLVATSAANAARDAERIYGEAWFMVIVRVGVAHG